ncbi:hypothetical protein TNCV_121311 [Trichonephila clavipes]|nr:hypothetical protein TNCV_121311 [Trichonephila clavipes]
MPMRDGNALKDLTCISPATGRIIYGTRNRRILLRFGRMNAGYHDRQVSDYRKSAGNGSIRVLLTNNPLWE